MRGTEAAGLETPTRALSGGNMQKLILGRALMGDPSAASAELIVANQPTWGLDIGAVAYVHQQLLDACAAGAAVLLISEDLDEIFALADRIAVMHHGRLDRSAAGGAVDAGRDRPRDERRAATRRHRCCGLNAAPSRRAWRSSPRRSAAVVVHAAASPRCSSPGPARRSAAPTRCCSRAASARASRWGETLTRATPLILTGLAAAVAFKARLFNIGAEGQLYLGALAAVAVGGLHGGSGFALAPWLLFPLMMLAAAAAGALLLLGPALLKSRLGVDEVVTTLLLNFIVLLFVSLMLDGPMKDPTAMGWPQSVALQDALQLDKLVERSRVHSGLLWALALSLRCGRC